MDISAILKTLCPWIATALTGPLGGMAVGWACDALGATDKTKEGLQSALSGATTEQMLALKNSDQTFAIKMQELGFKQISDLESLSVEDRKDARQMQVSNRSMVPAVLSAAVTIGYFGILIGMMSGSLKVSDSQALLIMLGSLTTAWAAQMAFWFGTTANSGRKDEMLAASAPAVTK